MGNFFVRVITSLDCVRKRTTRKGTAKITMLCRLRSGYEVDQAILGESDRVVIVRFGHEGEKHCLTMDDCLSRIVRRVAGYAVIYIVDIFQVPDFTTMYELYDPCTVMFFYRNKHIMVDLGTGNNNKINWALNDRQEFIDLTETVYRGARKGR